MSDKIIDFPTKQQPEATSEEQQIQQTQAADLVDLFYKHKGDLFRLDWDESTACATVKIANKTDTFPIRSRRFQHYLRRLFKQERKRPTTAAAISEAVDQLEAEAEKTREVFIRVGHSCGKVYIDIADTERNVIEICADGWKVLPGKEVPVLFMRPDGLLPLPIPTKGGSLDELRSFLNLREKDDFYLVTAFLVGALMPRGPFPCLAFRGDQGSGKSTHSRMIVSLVDPSEPAIRSMPKSELDLVIAAFRSRVVAFDNISEISDTQSDAIARLLTGTGLGGRKLYTDMDESRIRSCIPVIMNSIEEVIRRADLRKRTILVELAAIDGERRKTEAALWEEFDQARPRIIGALCNAVASAIRNRDQTPPGELPRMADFAAFVCAAEEGLDWKPGTFLNIYNRRISEAIELVIENSPFAEAVRDFIVNNQEDTFIDSTGRVYWEGTASDLLKQLQPLDGFEPRNFPKTGQGVRRALQRYQSTLAQVGITIEFNAGRTVDNRPILRLLGPRETKDTPLPPFTPKQSPQSPESPGTLFEAGHSDFQDIVSDPDEEVPF